MVESSCVKAIVWFDGPEVGSWNMAVDQAMTQYAADENCIILRLYQWASPTLSLGYFQAYDERLSLPSLATIDCVRRETGGGAIVHHHEITYSLAVPRMFENSIRMKSQPLPGASDVAAGKTSLRHSELLYQVIHDRTIKWLVELGFNAKTYESLLNAAESPLAAKHAHSHAGANSTPFLCFDRRSDVDVVFGSIEDNRKILGSAQRRSSRALLQHGSLLLSPSTSAPHLTGLNALGPLTSASSSLRTSTNINAEKWCWAIDFCRVLQDSVDELWDCEWRFEEPPQEVREFARTICDEKFGAPSWTLRRDRSQG
jgi:lipoate-protein ligase A